MSEQEEKKAFKEGLQKDEMIQFLKNVKEHFEGDGKNKSFYGYLASLILVFVMDKDERVSLKGFYFQVKMLLEDEGTLWEQFQDFVPQSIQIKYQHIPTSSVGYCG